MPELTDEVLARRAAAGQRECFEALVVRHRARIYGLCYRMAGNPEDAEDWAQECFVRIYQQLGRYNPSLSFVPWMVRVSSNTCLNLMSARSRRRALAPAGLDENVASGGEESPAVAMLRREEQAQITAAVQELPPLLRQALVLRHQEELSFKEVAEALDVPLQTAATRVRRALQQVRERLLKGSD